MKGFIEVTKLDVTWSVNTMVVMDREKIVLSLRTINWFKPITQKMFSKGAYPHEGETVMSCGGDSAPYDLILKDTPEKIKEMIIDAS